ncbi:MAG: SDR family NAD(P)-dependent oxidoreductase [Candidatus Sumerlaeia bacterium]|nr:SDR family NAD(P)-dependent oxidoreductase [Candidatus Sumerlaeia bacterium]
MTSQSLWIRRGVVLLADAFLLYLAWLLAFELRFGEEFAKEVNQPYRLQRSLLAVWVVLVQLGLFAAFKLYLTNFRFTGVPELKKLVLASATGLLVFFGFNLFLESQKEFFDLPINLISSTESHVYRIPRQVIFLYVLLGFLFAAGFRFSNRLWREGRTQYAADAPEAVLIGSARNCQLMLQQLLKWSEAANSEARFRPVGIVYLDEAPLESHYAGLKAVRGLAALPDLMEKTGATVVLVSSEGASQKRLNDIVELCKGRGIRLLVVPSIADLDDGKVDLRTLKRVKVEDLLSRPKVEVMLPESRQYLRGKRVLITGAGGSIGSELARQILPNQPESVILLGRGENSLHELKTQLGAYNGLFTTVICDIRDEHNMTELFERFRPNVVFHAAAHKHVTFMERQPLEALSNNVLGTLNVARLADAFECERFVLISTDKAVKPSSIMGASKRLAEEVVFSIAAESRTLFNVVRFGNVLGSRGSALRVFESQMEKRQPITVTDPEATRYFMMVEEAVSLVLRAGSQNQPSMLYLLEMGDPVRIGSLVENLLSLSGIPFEERPEIKIIGLQPGEKLHEELLTQEEDASATELEKVWKVQPRSFLHQPLEQAIEEIRALISEGDSPLAVAYMLRHIPGYTPSGIIPVASDEELDNFFAEVFRPQPVPKVPQEFSVLESAPEPEPDPLISEQEEADDSSPDDSQLLDTSSAITLASIAEQLEEALEEEMENSLQMLSETTEPIAPPEVQEEVLSQNSSEFVGDLFGELPESEESSLPEYTPQNTAELPILQHTPEVEEQSTPWDIHPQEGSAVPEDLPLLDQLEETPPLSGYREPQESPENVVDSSETTTKVVQVEAESTTHQGQGLTPEPLQVVQFPESTDIVSPAPELLWEAPEEPAEQTSEHVEDSNFALQPHKENSPMSQTTGIPCVFIALLEGVAPAARAEMFQHLAQRMAANSHLMVTGLGDLSEVPAAIAPRTTLLSGPFVNDAAKYNAAIAAAPENALLIALGQNVFLNPEFCAQVSSFADAHKDAYVLYPNYIEEKNGKSVTVKLHEHAGCPHERFDFGSMVIYRTRAVREVGGFDESLFNAWEYDMHLKLMEIGLIKNLPEVLYTYKIVQVADSSAGALHSPGRGKLGGFSYVFYPEDVEREVTTVFEKALKRIGAWIDHDFANVPQPKHQTPVLASVVIPILNRVRYIENAIRKVQQGTFQDFEIIIVDNGSTDGTIQLIERLAAEDSRIRLFHGTGGSIASALNHGIREARGKYICQLDSDDEYAPTTLEKMIGHLESHPKCGLAISYYRLMNEKGEILHDIAPITHSGYSRNQILRRDGGGAVRIFPKAVLEEFGLYDEVNYGNFGEDYDMVLKTGEKYSVDRVHEVLYHYRRHEDNTDVTRDPEMKYKNKNRSRQEALRRRIALNQQLQKV